MNFQKYFYIFKLIFLAFFPFVPLLAQNPLRPPTEPPPEPEVLPPLEQILPPFSEPPALPQPPQILGSIVVQQFEVIGSTIFSREELTTLLEPYTKRPISFTELLQAQEAITKLYVDQGYITSGAFIPPQAIKDGVVKIEVIEGKIEALEITGLKRLRDNYVRSRISRGTGTPLNTRDLLEALQLLQLDPLISNLQAELSAGTRPGLSVLTVKVQEDQSLSALLRLDNERNSSVGSQRRILQINHANLLGFGDRFNVQYYNTDGSNALDDLSYSIPVNPTNGTIGLRYRLIDSKIIDEPFNVLDIQSNYHQYEISYRQPIILKPTEELALGINVDHQFADTSLRVDVNERLESDTEVTAIRLSQEYIKRDNRQVFAVRSQFNIGLQGAATDLNGNQISDQFFSWESQAQYLRVLASDTLFVFRTNLQLSPNELLSLEQFGIGGIYTVRGYPQDLLLADNGFSFSAEVRQNILKIPAWQTTLQLTPFFDFGTVWNNSDVELSKNTLYSVGLGLRLLIGNNFTAQLDWGIPLVDLDYPVNSLQDNGLHFSIQYRLFFF
ncbi:ShlB/FhaC/HecB family hemolysin secretion/activation protein [Chroococcus sp. FPU101]|uniref:ShlB/FhaC/HecB family hemolysin secretion/activation protein n=1 Tax=Chroococcus sp. FPU101 TaxID=1974212 RepID=UPI001A8CC048|nr:ShlB/FhaC/HecB family hemolysin secretion/activation protein [Chroococcus sp. FPU101]GFE71055.1 Surface antigen variable number [Chroococcus sp. FPU101]